MVNLTFNFTKALRKAHASAQWYVDRSINRERENVKNRINAELSGCWRCSGRQQGICDCCSHKAAADELEEIAKNVRTLTIKGES